jgi:dihydroorotase
MNLLLTGGTVYQNGTFIPADVAISEGVIVSIAPDLPRDGFSVIQVYNDIIVPGFVDVHVHLREPGFSYKETIDSGTRAAACGGYTAVCAMPNLKPVPDSRWHIRPELRAIRRGAHVRVYPYGAITAGEGGTVLADMAEIARFVIGFSDDGHGVQNEALLRCAMEQARKLDLPIAAHCEVEELVTPGGCVHAGQWAQTHGFPGISSQSEWRMVERDLRLVREIGCRYHVCHVSTRESVELIRQAKAEGLPVSCETAPHYLLLCEEDLRDEGRFRMNPPLRAAEDRDALLEGLLDGTIDCVATDHAPHAQEEKAGGLRNSASGIVGLETAFPLLYTQLMESGIMPLSLLLEKFSMNPRRIFRLPGGEIAPGEIADLTVIDPNRPHVVNSAEFRSRGRSTPFEGWPLSAAIALTVCGGEAVYGNVGNGEEA